MLSELIYVYKKTLENKKTALHAQKIKMREEWKVHANQRESISNEECAIGSSVL